MQDAELLANDPPDRPRAVIEPALWLYPPEKVALVAMSVKDFEIQPRSGASLSVTRLLSKKKPARSGARARGSAS